MTDKAKILAEIERLRKNLPWGGSAAQLSFECNCKNEAYTEIEKFINSLPEEHVSPCVECASISEGCKEICYDYNKWVRDNHKEEPVSGELKEAAIEICSKILKGETVVIDGYEYVVLSDAEECFKAGSQWQKKRDTKNLRAEIQRRYEHHLGCMQGSTDDTYPEISHAHHRVIKDELFEILRFLDVLENETE